MARTKIDASLITPIRGTTTNDNAAAGNVGEYISSWANFQNVPTSGDFGDATSISLTTGDWDVSVIAVWLLNGAVITGNCMAGVSTTSGNSATGSINGDTISYTAIPTATSSSGSAVPSVRFSLSSTTTLYLKFRCGAYTGGPPQVASRISARRVR